MNARVILIGCLFALMVTQEGTAQPQLEWYRTYAYLDWDEGGNDLLLTSDRRLVIAGWAGKYIVESDGAAVDSTRAFVVKTNLDGEVIWQRTYGADRQDARAIVETNDGNYVLYGMGPYPDSSTVVWKITPDGEVLWKTAFPLAIPCMHCLVLDSGSNVAIAGEMEGTPPNDRMPYIARLDAQGQTLWDSTYTSLDRAFALYGFLALDDGYAFLGGYHVYTPLNAAVMTIGSDGTFRQIYTLADPNYYSWITGGLQLSDGSIVTTGASGSFSRDYKVDALVGRIDNSGRWVWRLGFGGDEDDVGHAMVEAEDGAFILTGYSKSYGGGDNAGIYMAGVSSTGAMMWDVIQPLSTYAGSADLVVVDDRIFVAGRIFGEKSALLARWTRPGIVANESPVVFSLDELDFEAFPNPTTQVYTIRFQEAMDHPVSIAVLDVLGREIKTWIQPAGANASTWDLTDQSGRRVSSGLYLLRFSTGDKTQFGKPIIVR